jgi:nucleoside-triphosphatase
MPPLRLFLTGEPACGKTTVIRRIVNILASQGMKVGGIISGEIRPGAVRVGFSLEDVLTHETGTLAHVNLSDGPRVGKYRVNLSDIERVGAGAIQRAIADADVIIIDELGPMELHSEPFIAAVEMALRSPKHLIGTIHKRASHRLVTAIKSNPNYQVIEVTVNNREQMPSKILEQVTAHTRARIDPSLFTNQNSTQSLNVSPPDAYGPQKGSHMPPNLQ